VRQKNERGAMAVEFALVAPILLVLVGGILEFGILLFHQAVITNASREAARAGIVASSPKPTVANIQSVASNYLARAGLNAARATINVTGAGLAFGNNLTVSVIYPYRLAFVVNIPNLGAATTMKHE
jgi:Flp pilus assembly protein TadG